DRVRVGGSEPSDPVEGGGRETVPDPHGDAERGAARPGAADVRHLQAAAEPRRGPRHAAGGDHEIRPGRPGERNRRRYSAHGEPRQATDDTATPDHRTRSTMGETSVNALSAV